MASCSETPGSDNWARLDYETNPASAKYDFSVVDEAVADFMADHPAVEGVTLAVVRGAEGQIYEEGYDDGVDRDRISLIASTGKVLSAGVILALVDDGLLELDRPIAEYLDWGDYHSAVTMRQILSMTSGLPPSFWIADACYSYPCECDPATSIQACGRTVFQDESLSIPPGEEFLYTRWQLAGAVAEIVSNMSWAELVRQKLVAPCGLPDTGYRRLFPEYPEAFDGDPANLPETENPGLGGGAYSTVNDYSKVLLMHLREGLCGQERVLSPGMVQAMQEDLVPEGVAMPSWRPEAINYGMGWWKYEDE
ncbi:MAG: beta-lactamase family protein, partial [Deltaproteobacteria bacterium]|nr:beta-lactamase family protein [Deltaproteobacteria bacterium]